MTRMMNNTANRTHLFFLNWAKSNLGLSKGWIHIGHLCRLCQRNTAPDSGAGPR